MLLCYHAFVQQILTEHFPNGRKNSKNLGHISVNTTDNDPGTDLLARAVHLVYLSSHPTCEFLLILQDSVQTHLLWKVFPMCPGKVNYCYHNTLFISLLQYFITFFS